MKEPKPLTNRHLKIVELSGEIAGTPCEEVRALGFMSRLLVMVNLPYRNPGDEARTWWRKNGNVSINITPAYRENKNLGIPYGSYPRLILAT